MIKEKNIKTNFISGDYVVYPSHGVGKIIAVEKSKIGNIDITYYKVFVEKERNPEINIGNTSCQQENEEGPPQSGLRT